MALVLLVGAGLMLRTLFHLWRVDPGFDAHNVINFSVTPPPSLVRQAPDAIRSELRRINASMRMAPGIDSASLSWGASPMQSDSEEPFLVEGQQPPLHRSDLPQTLDYVVGPEYFSVMHIPLLRGRLMTEDDNERSTRIALIDSSFARRYFPGQDPVGKHVRILDFDSDPRERTWIPLTIVGVVGHVSQFGLFDDGSYPLHAQLYRSFLQASDFAIKDAATGVGAMVRFRSPLNPDAAFEELRKKLSLDFDQMIVSDNRAEVEVVARSIARQRFALVLLGSFAGLALLLASIGIYGVLSYLVGQRTQEIGVRMAVGARPVDVLRMILEDGSRLTMIGTAIGIGAALGLTRLMENLLFGITPNDPATFAAVTAALCGVALFACYVPARRAAKIDPLVALRYE
jgi:predicted permease